MDSINKIKNNENDNNNNDNGNGDNIYKLIIDYIEKVFIII